MAKNFFLNFMIIFITQVAAESVKRADTFTEDIPFILMWSMITSLIFINLIVFFLRFLKSNPNVIEYIDSLEYIEYVAIGVLILFAVFGHFDLIIVFIGNTIASARMTKEFKLIP